MKHLITIIFVLTSIVMFAQIPPYQLVNTVDEDSAVTYISDTDPSSFDYGMMKLVSRDTFKKWLNITGNGTSFGFWKYSNLVACCPAMGYFNFNNTIGSSTTWYINEVDLDGLDWEMVLALLQNKDVIVLSSIDNVGTVITFRVGAGVDGGSYYSFSLSLVSVTGIPVNEEKYRIDLLARGGDDDMGLFSNHNGDTLITNNATMVSSGLTLRHQWSGGSTYGAFSIYGGGGSAIRTMFTGAGGVTFREGLSYDNMNFTLSDKTDGEFSWGFAGSGANDIGFEILAQGAGNPVNLRAQGYANTRNDGALTSIIGSKDASGNIGAYPIQTLYDSVVTYINGLGGSGINFYNDSSYLQYGKHLDFQYGLIAANEADTVVVNIDTTTLKDIFSSSGISIDTSLRSGLIRNDSLILQEYDNINNINTDSVIIDVSSLQENIMNTSLTATGSHTQDFDGYYHTLDNMAILAINSNAQAGITMTGNIGFDVNTIGLSAEGGITAFTPYSNLILGSSAILNYSSGMQSAQILVGPSGARLRHWTGNYFLGLGSSEFPPLESNPDELLVFKRYLTQGRINRMNIDTLFNKIDSSKWATVNYVDTQDDLNGILSAANDGETIPTSQTFTITDSLTFLGNAGQAITLSVPHPNGTQLEITDGDRSEGIGMIVNSNASVPPGLYGIDGGGVFRTMLTYDNTIPVTIFQNRAQGGELEFRANSTAGVGAGNEVSVAEMHYDSIILKQPIQVTTEPSGTMVKNAGLDASGNLIYGAIAEPNTHALIKEDNVLLSTDAPTLDFYSASFDIVESPTDEFQIRARNILTDNLTLSANRTHTFTTNTLTFDGSGGDLTFEPNDPNAGMIKASISTGGNMYAYEMDNGSNTWRFGVNSAEDFTIRDQTTTTNVFGIADGAPASGFYLYNTGQTRFSGYASGGVFAEAEVGLLGHASNGDISSIPLGSDGQLLSMDGSNSFAWVDITDIETVVLEDVTSGKNKTVFFTDDEITITQVNDVIIGSSSPEVDYNIYFASARNAGSPTAVFGSDRTVTSESGAETTSFTNATISAGNWVWVETTGETGTIDELALSIEYVK